MAQCYSFRRRHLHEFAIGAFLMVPAMSMAEEFNMPQFGRVEKQVTETIDFYDLKGTSQISSSSSNNSFATVVFTPANPGEAVQITFSRIHLKGDGKNYPVSLSVFDGNYDEDVTYPTTTSSVPVTDFPDNGRLIQRYYSAEDKSLIEETDITFTSSEPDGALSVCFLYKYAAACDGWEAKVSSVTLTDQQLLAATEDYSSVNPQVYGGLKDVCLGSLNLTTEGILNPFKATSVSFDLDDPDGILENVRLYAAGKPIEAQPAVDGQTYTFPLDFTLSAGDNIFSVKADVKGSAPFYSSASLQFTGIATTAPSTPAITRTEPASVTVAALVMMPADGSHLTATVEDGKSVLFYDNGGPEANYPEQSSGTVTFKPAEGSEGKVMIDFSSITLFNTNPAKNDRLVVYNGTEAQPGNELVTLLKQTKALVRSTSDDGALTVSFSTTTGVTKAGWEATASLFTPTAMTLVGTDITAASDKTVNAGDTGCELLRMLVKTKDTEPAMILSGITLDFDTTAPQWENVRIYSTRHSETLNLADALMLAESPVAGEGMTLTLDTPLTLLEGDNYLWVTADIKESARSGETVNAIVKSLCLNGTDEAVTAPSGATGRTVRNLVYPSKTHPVKTVYGSMEVANKPYSEYYGGYEGTKDDLLVTFLPSGEGHVCEIDFSKLNLYYYESSWSPSSNVTPVFKVFAGTAAEGEPLYVHVKDNNLADGEDSSAIGTIRSTAADGALTILFNAGTTGSSTTKDTRFGFSGEVREYQSRPMTAISAEAFASGQTTVPIATATNVPVIGLKVVTEGNLNPLPLESVAFTLKADPSIYSSLKLASSGHKMTADNASVIATATPDGASVTFSPAAPLSEGENIFWLLADIDSGAAPGSVVDAKIDALTIAGNGMEVADSDPEGEILTVNTYDPVLGDKEQTVEVGEHPVVINGVTAAYMTNDYTITAKPAIEGGKVTATFTEGSFNVNTSYQYITVIGGAEPFGVDYDTTYPVSVTSTREDGRLIIEYHSMTIANEDGWKCTLSCDARKPMTMTDFKNISAGAANATRGSDVLVGGLGFDVSGDKNEITLTGFGFDIPDAPEIFSELRLYATGEDPEFLRNKLIASNDATSTTLVPSEPLVIAAAGKYHFWLLGVVKPDAAIGSSAVIKPASLTYTTAGTEETADLSGLDAKTLTIVEGFHGTFNIGSSVNAAYPDFASAVRDLADGIEGPVKFIVEPGTYNERLDLDHIQGVSATNTITFEGESGDPSDVVLVSDQWVEPPYSDDKLEHYYGVATIRGTSHVALRGMTVKTTNVEFPSVIHIADGSSDVTIEDCVVSAPASSTTYNNLTLVNSYVGQSSTSVNNRLSVIGSDLRGGYCGIKFGSANVSQPESEGITVSGCSFANQGYQAIYLYFAKDVTLTDNSLTGTAGSSDKNYCQMIDLDISGPATIERNILESSKTGTYGLYLRRLAGSDDSPVIIANNILDIDAGSRPGAAIQLYNSASKPYTGFLIAHNTVETSGSDIIMPLIINVKTGTEVNGLIANNIFLNSARTYVIKEQYGPSGATYRNNAGYTPDSDYAYWGGNYDQTMTWNQWILASGETGGVNALIPFDNSDDTRPLWPASFADLKQGTPLPEVPTDFLGVTRDTTAPTIGAYESFTSAIDGIEADTTMSDAAPATLTAGDFLAVEADNADLRIYSLSGVLLMQVRVNGAASIPVGDLPRGLFVMTIGDQACRLLLR